MFTMHLPMFVVELPHTRSSPFGLKSTTSYDTDPKNLSRNFNTNIYNVNKLKEN